MDDVDLGGEAPVAVLAEAEARQRDVALEDLDPGSASELGGRRPRGGDHPRLDQRDDAVLGVALEQRGDEAAADEAREAGDEMGLHSGNPTAGCRVRDGYGRAQSRDRSTA